ncbi:MAG: hypothetical protein SVM80_07565 [Halobacteriota archaeon]|nr:hypothetical protein [Halobacteriota archaeon]
MDDEKKITFATIIVCIIGIVIVSFIIITTTSLTNTTFTESYSWLYFEEYEELPRVIAVGNKEEFAFTVASFQHDTTSYTYKASLAGEILDEGDFMLHPGENMTVNVPFISTEPGIMFLRNLTITDSDQLTYDRTTTTINSMPIEVPIINSEDSGIVLNLDPDSEESYSFTSSRTEPFGDILERPIDYGAVLVEPRFSSAGINFINYNTTVDNDAGDIRVTYKKAISEYHYEFKNVSVVVNSDDGTEYEIHFWAIVA